MRAAPGRRTEGLLKIGVKVMRCVLGRDGIQTLKREGDGATPAGVHPVRQVFYRPDRVPRPRTALASGRLKPDSGWCDEAADRNYNRFVRHPYPASAERMWRADRLYDLVIVLGYNDVPRRRGRGSAIFMHVARPGYAPTEGCIALSSQELRRVAGLLRPGDCVRVIA